MYNLPVLSQGVKLPSFTIEDKHLERLKLKRGISDYEFLRALTLEGFLALKIPKGTEKYKEYVERIKKELALFNELGFCSYLLITWDIVNFCRENKIAMGYGRGSCCGSEVLRLIGVTKVSAIDNGLFFERFLSKFRAKFTEIDGVRYYQGDLLLDIDLDVEFKERHRVSKYVEEKYAGRVCKLLTTTTFTTKILVKTVSKAMLEFTEEQAKQLSDMIPKEFGVVASLTQAREKSKEFNKFCEDHPDFYESCYLLSDLQNGFGCHASAWIISADPIKDIFPLQLSEKGELMTGYAMEDVLNIAAKVDLLGLRCATLISQVSAKIGISPDDIDINHPSIYEKFQDLKYSHGLFQIEADTNHHVLRKVKPKTLAHLSGVLALARPGALAFVDTYSKYVESGEAQLTHPIFDPILKESAGIPIYQESLMRCAHSIGFTLDESEILRRIVGKKKVHEVAIWQQKIKDKIKDNNLDPKAGDILWDVLDKSARYSFNLSHSLAYASMCAATCYLKFNHPLEFYECLLNLAGDEPDPLGEIEIIANEMNACGIKLYPPDLLKSDFAFKIEGDGIRFGLSSIKNVSDASIKKIISFRRVFANKFEILNAAQESKIPINLLSSLIFAGCLDLGSSKRSRLVFEAQTYYLLSEREKQLVHKVATESNNDLLNILMDLRSKTDEKGKPYIKDSRWQTFLRDYDPYKKMYLENIKSDELCIYLAEKHFLGFSSSSSLHSIFEKKIANLSPISKCITEPKNTSVRFVGFVNEVKKAISKNKKPYIKLFVSDESGSVTAMLFGEDKIRACELHNGSLPEEDDIVVIHGKSANDGAVFIDNAVIQNNPIKLTRRDLNN